MSCTVRKLLAALCCCFVVTAPDALASEAYPQKPITLVVPSVPGGAADALARMVAEGLAKRLGKAVIVDNRPGAGTTLGTQLVAKAPADGHTLLLGLDSALTTSPYLLDKMPYQPQADLTPIGTLATLQFILVASPVATFHSVADLVAQARARPGSITYASGGEGSVHHLAMELLQKDAGIELRHVPYKAAPQGFLDVMGSHVDTMFIAPGTAVAPIKAQKVKGLAISGSMPVADAPDLPALKDQSATKGFVFESWFGLLVRSGTPPAIVEKLQSALADVTSTPDAKKQMQTLGLTLTAEGPQQLRARIDTDTKRYASIVAKLKEKASKP
jgi:tripartite-type tricarboxylate transporter receptor subunit TctC